MRAAPPDMCYRHPRTQQTHSSAEIIPIQLAFVLELMYRKSERTDGRAEHVVAGSDLIYVYVECDRTTDRPTDRMTK